MTMEKQAREEREWTAKPQKDEVSVKDEIKLE